MYLCDIYVCKYKSSNNIYCRELSEQRLFYDSTDLANACNKYVHLQITTYNITLTYPLCFQSILLAVMESHM